MTNSRAGLTIMFLTVLLLTPPRASSEGGDTLLGEWNTATHFQDNAINGKLVLSRNSAGDLQGTWIARRGEANLSGIHIKNNELSFARTIYFQGREYALTFKGSVTGGELKGTFKSPMGILPVTGVRLTSPGEAAPSSQTNAARLTMSSRQRS